MTTAPLNFLARVCPSVKPLVFDLLPPISITADLKHYDLKKWENSHFYRILRQKMTLNDNDFTRFLVRICSRSKLLVFDPLLPIRDVLKHLQLKKV